MLSASLNENDFYFSSILLNQFSILSANLNENDFLKEKKFEQRQKNVLWQKYYNLEFWRQNIYMKKVYIFVGFDDLSVGPYHI